MNINYLEYRRRLPHYQNANKIYDVTFATKHRWGLPPAARTVVLHEIERMHDREAFIHCGVPMPDHVHLVMQPLFDERGYPFMLPDVLKLLKGRSSRAINLAI